MKTRTTLVAILCLFLGKVASAQDVSPRPLYVVNQMLGQGIWFVGLEHNFLQSKHVQLAATGLIGLQANGDSEYGIYATYAFQPGAVMLLGVDPFYIELAPCGNVNRRQGHTFGSLNMGSGLRYVTDDMYISVLYMPIVYSTFTAASEYDGIAFGLRLGVNLYQ